MEQYKQEFIEFMIDCNVLKFGEFTLTKSGRKIPVFRKYRMFIVTGAQLRKLGEYYAKAIHKQISVLDFDVLFGPAYKGIPLTVAADNGDQRRVWQGYSLLLQS